MIYIAALKPFNTPIMQTNLPSFQIESVDLALKILDGYEVRGKKIKVQQAQFQMRGEYDPSRKPKKKKKDKEKMKKMKEKYVSCI